MQKMVLGGGEGGLCPQLGCKGHTPAGGLGAKPPEARVGLLRHSV